MRWDRVYPFDLLEPGDRFFVAKPSTRMTAQIACAKRRTGFHLISRNVPGGCRVWRVGPFRFDRDVPIPRWVRKGRKGRPYHDHEIGVPVLYSGNHRVIRESLRRWLRKQPVEQKWTRRKGDGGVWLTRLS